jgi:hypothetical protein
VDTVEKLKELFSDFIDLENGRRFEIIKCFFSPYIVDPIEIEKHYIVNQRGRPLGS